jgi:hypothetical protein
LSAIFLPGQVNFDPLSFSCPHKVDEPSFDISPYELNVNSTSGIKTFKPSYQLSFHRRVE